MATSIKGMTVREFREMMQKEHPNWIWETSSAKEEKPRVVTYTYIPEEKKYWEERKARAEARKESNNTNEETNQ